jgi:cytochrome c oxidase subunit IV
MKSLFQKFESSSGAQHGSPSDVEHPHVMPLPIYFLIFGILLFFTVVTVGVSLLGLPPIPAIIVAVVVATIKASLVVLYFMHLRYENTFYSFIFIGSLFFVGLFFLITLLDMNFRGFIVPQQATEYYRNEQIQLKQEAAQAEAAKAGSETPASSDSEPSTGAEGSHGTESSPADGAEPAPAH